MKKRMLTALLTCCLALSLAVPALGAQAAVSEDEAAQAVTTLGIMAGDASGDLDLSGQVTRAEFVTMAVKASPGGGQIGQAATSPYPDVPRSHWASGYVEAAVARGLVSGYSDGTFRPDRPIGLAEGVSLVLSLLGYGPEDFSGAYPTGQLALYHSLKLDRGVTARSAADPLTRRDAMYLFYNLLSAATPEGAPYIESLGHSLDASGRVDLLELVNGEMEGPAVAQGDWQSALPFDPALGTVYRDGSRVSPAAVQDYDVLYWNASVSTVWAYSRKASGAIQALEPDQSAPTSVTVAGRAYSIETSQAAYALSDLGDYGLGDTVTLLLGRSGGVAAVADVSAAGAGERVGMVIQVSEQQYPDGAGGSYTAQTVTLLATDGQTYQYQTRGGYRVGSVVRAGSFGQDGQITLRGLSSSSLTGRVSDNGEKLGDYRFAPGATILDVADGQGAVYFPERLAGVSLSSGDVRYYSLNSQGEIDQMILEEVTGDMYQYGILTRREEMGEGLDRIYSYEYDVAGTDYALPASTTGFRADIGPIQLTGDPADPERIYSLTAAGQGTISGRQFLTDQRRYTLSDQVLVYERRGGQYLLSTLARAQEGDFTLTAWYDKPEAQGGRVRVIVAREN